MTPRDLWEHIGLESDTLGAPTYPLGRGKVDGLRDVEAMIEPGTRTALNEDPQVSECGSSPEVVRSRESHNKLSWVVNYARIWDATLTE